MANDGLCTMTSTWRSAPTRLKDFESLKHRSYLIFRSQYSLAKLDIVSNK
jgi:hypothetical protein